MKYTKFLISLAIFFTSKSASSQNQTNCTDAISQLQNYAAQINQIYNNEYWAVIPNQRCPAFNQIGQPYNPGIVQNCRLQMLAYLNNWYSQQCFFVNRSYATIAQGCLTQQPSNLKRPAPKVNTGSEENEKIDTEKIEDLTAGVDEDKTVRITIPKTAEGFKPR